MDNELLRWLQVISPIVTLVVSALLAIAGYFAKKTIDGYGEEMKTMRTAHGQLKEDFMKFQVQLPRVYVLKDDNIRHMTILENKIDDNFTVTQGALASVAGDIKLLLREMPKRKNDG